MEQIEQSIADYSVVIQRDPNFVGAYHGRGMSYVQAGLPEQALPDFEESIRIDDTYGPTYAARAIAYTLLGRDDEAEQDVERAESLGHERSLIEADIARIKEQRQ